MDTGSVNAAGGLGAAAQALPSVARRPEFSQCFGDKAALEELTDGACVWSEHTHERRIQRSTSEALTFRPHQPTQRTC